MNILLGNVALLGALVSSLALCFGEVFSKFSAKRLAIITFVFMTVAFATLVYAYITSDFSVLNVMENSHTLKPMIFKVTGVWGNHEGSMLLWVWMLALWGALVAVFESGGGKMKTHVLQVQGMLVFGFTLFVAMTSNPFTEVFPVPVEGMDLNPILQDMGLASHPPLLYMGYVGFSIAFCFAMAALKEQKVDAVWAKLLRPWVLAAWVFLTAGIAAGSAWAYYELGWGGFWFWDPVENASLMPWLAGTALLHSISVLEKRGQFANWVVFLAILAFGFSILGTFLVRAGLLTSVHAFASDPTRGVFILALMIIFLGGAFWYYARQAPKVGSADAFAPVSRETTLLLNNVFLFTFCITVLLGTTYPIILSALNLGSISVGPPYYVMTLVPLLIPFALLMGAAPYVAWKKGFVNRFFVPYMLTAALLLWVAVLPVKEKAFSLLCFALGGWIAFATFYDWWRKRNTKVTLSYIGMVIAHIGVGVLIIGATATTQWKEEVTLWMQPEQSVEVAGQTIVFQDTSITGQDNYLAQQAVFEAGEGVLISEKRFYPVQGTTTSEVAMQRHGLDVLYLVVGEQDQKNADRFVVRIYYHPLAVLILLGAAYMVAGGVLSFADRRRRK